MSEPLVSVVIPTHNRASLLPRALRSALGQTYRNLEVIVVDDASTDDTASVVKNFGDPRIRYLVHETNRGGSAARNTGIRAATGEYIAFLDSDDEWLPTKLEKQISGMRAGNWLFSYHQSIQQQGDQRIIGTIRPYTNGSFIRYLVCTPDGGMCTPSFVVHRDVVVYFDDQLSVLQDWDWMMQLRRRTDRFLFVHEPLCEIHFDAPIRARASRGRPLIDRVRPFLNKYASELAAEPDVKRHIVWGAALHARNQGDKKLCRAILKEHRIYPSLFRKPHAFTIWF